MIYNIIKIDLIFEYQLSGAWRKHAHGKMSSDNTEITF